MEFETNELGTCVCVCVCARALKLCPTLCYPVDCSPSSSSVQEIFQVGILEWVAFPPPGDLPNPGIEPVSLVSSTLATWRLLLCHLGSNELESDCHICITPGEREQGPGFGQ